MKLNARHFAGPTVMALALFLGACSRSEPQAEQKPAAVTPPPAPVVEQKAEVAPAPAPKPVKKAALEKKPVNKEAVMKKAQAPKMAAPQEASAKLPAAEVVMPSGLKYVDLVEGRGERFQSGQTASMHYTGYLTNGTKFDSSRDHGAPFTVKIGMGQVIEGWEKGIPGMKVGGKRRLTIPPELGYGANGAGNVIPPNATLIFEVDLLEIKP